MEWIVAAAVAAILLASGWFVVRKRRAVSEVKQPEKRLGLAEKLGKTRSQFLGRLSQIAGQSDTEWEALEEILLEADVGVRAAQALLLNVRKNVQGALPLRTQLRQEFESMLGVVEHGAPKEGWPKPYVISIVGINGVGKTTTIGKLASWFQKGGKRVLVGAADTFRAAATAQLQIWAERTGAEIVTGREGGDPGAVAFDAVNAGKSRGSDVILIDTAGRLHTKGNLMDELKKIHRVIQKVIPEAPHETWLILDGTAGQNSIRQAQEFQKALPLTGAIVTKLDGTAKGGALLSVATELKLPIRFIGVGEGSEDLLSFNAKSFVEAILGE